MLERVAAGEVVLAVAHPGGPLREPLEDGRDGGAECGDRGHHDELVAGGRAELEDDARISAGVGAGDASVVDDAFGGLGVADDVGLVAEPVGHPPDRRQPRRAAPAVRVWCRRPCAFAGGVERFPWSCVHP